MSIISGEKLPSEKIFRENWNSEMQSHIPFFWFGSGYKTASFRSTDIIL